MKAAYISNYVKSFDEIIVGEVPKPTLRPGHALVKIKAAAANPLDKMVVLGYAKSMWAGLPYTLGVDFSGIVEQVGEGVTDFKSGDEVFGLNWSSKKGMADDDVPDPIVGGCYAEYIVIPARKLSKKPSTVSFEVAASIGVVGTTAYEALIQVGKVTSQSKILIIGGSTAVGVVAIQIGKIVGAHVTTTSSTRALYFVKSFKPDKIINYNEEKWENEVKDVDVVLDCVGEKDGIPRAITSGVVKVGGTYVSIVDYLLGENFSAYPPLAWAGFFSATQNSTIQTDVAKFITEGKLRIPIENVFPFSKEGVVALLDKISGGKSFGKQVLVIN